MRVKGKVTDCTVVLGIGKCLLILNQMYPDIPSKIVKSDRNAAVSSVLPRAIPESAPYVLRPVNRHHS